MKATFVGLLFAASAVAHASTPAEKAEQFLQQVATQESDQAVDQLFAGSNFPSKNPEVVATLKNNVLLSMRLAGKPIGTEKADESDLTPSVKRLIYIQKFETQPTLWTFYFYRAHDEWMITGISFTDNIQAVPGLKW